MKTRANPNKAEGRVFRSAVCLLSVVLGLALASCAKPPQKVEAEGSDGKAQGAMRIFFFDAGDGDAALIALDDGTHIMIDTGLDENCEALVERMRQISFETIDLLVISHPDKDHIGGADAILESFDVKRVLVSPQKKGSKQEEQFEKALAERGAERIEGKAGMAFSWGEVTLKVIGPLSDRYDQMNDHSLVLMLETPFCKTLFAGDVENDAIEDMLNAKVDLRADVLKVPHHGRKEKLSAAFIQAVHPSLAVIPCEGEPDSEILEALGAFSCDAYVLGNGEVDFASSATSFDCVQ